jgi:hypothetical protein
VILSCSYIIARFVPGVNPAAALAEILSPRSVSRINSQVTICYFYLPPVFEIYTFVKILVASAMAEVLQGVYLVFELIFPARNFMFLILWWQYLQMRFH